MRFSVLASGSRANCTLVEEGDTRILIDCGLSAKQAEMRLLSIGIHPATIRAIVLTHEHSDHLAGVPVFSRRYGIPVYTNLGRIPGIDKTMHFERTSGFLLGNLTLHPFQISHDAADPVGFRIEGNGVSLGYATDLGIVSNLVRTMLRRVDALILEANHDPEMLERCSYPWSVKERIASERGHLSNEAAGALLEEILHPRLHTVVLAHLSEQSNTPDMALAGIRGALKSAYNGKLCCAGRHFSLPVIDLEERRVAMGVAA